MEINKTKTIKDLKKGTGLAAISNTLPDEILVQITSPYLLVVEKDSLSKVCSYCIRPATTFSLPLQRCSQCKVPRYCTTKCQTLHWKAIHKLECPLLRTLPDVPPTPVRGLMQLLLKHGFGERLDPKWAGLESHLEELRGGDEDRDRWGEFVMQANAAVHFCKLDSGMSMVAINMLARMSCNAFRATLVDGTPVGLCFEPVMALANHNCEPNASVVFDGRTISLVALTPIGKDEQITICYVEPEESDANRRAMLKRQYFFDCDCGRCNGVENQVD